MNCTEIITESISALTTIGAVYMAYRFAIGQMRKESIENLERSKYNAVLQAHQSIYRLLKYTTDTENEDSILRWEAVKGNKSEKTYYFRKEKIKLFLRELTHEFYEKGNGLYLSKEVNELLFNYRGIVFGLLLASKGETEDAVKINKEETAKAMIRIHQELSIQIRKDIQQKKRNLRFD
ncbi:MAG: CRISPR-associated protein Csx28 [Prevotella sp.]|nr:CRISPR-associated protein Csx28 [Prevotella sp.]